mmetsp:Transcript_7779/g.8809  ORF Transcript_7779/g.8809 Transcript_7779/m.8809 type:complete len:86 (+) Transcript_7779:369-626(+)
MIVLSLIFSVISQMFLIPIFFCLVIFNLYLAMFNFTCAEVSHPERIMKEKLSFIDTSSSIRSIRKFLNSPYGRGLCLNLKDYFCK